MIENLQSQLTKIYSLPEQEDIRQFIIDEEIFHQYYSNPPIINEQVLISCNESNETSIAVYFRREILENLTINQPLQELNQQNFADFCSVVEGVSHFLFVGVRTHFTLPVSALELEIQGEVDKFITSFIYFLYHNQTGPFIFELWRKLFENHEFRSGLDSEEKERYEIANNASAKLCYFLKTQFLSYPLLKTDWAGLLSFLRRFYRQSLSGKLETISSLC